MLATLLVVLIASGAGAEQEPPAPQEEPAPPPKLVIRGFGNIDFERRRDGSPGSFNLGELDLFVTSELTDELSVLAEIVLEPGEGDEPILDVERYQIKYSPSDRFNVALGRVHASLGYWNQTFHHGTWFQTTAVRPLVYRFEDEGGPLPVHEVGVQVSGAAPLRGLQLEYSLSVSNGRGLAPSDVEVLQDHNAAKAVNLWVGLTPRAVRGLKLGGVARFDTIPPDPAEPDRADDLDERILGGFAVYVVRRAELLAEVLRIRHEDAGGAAHSTLGLYVQGAWRFGRFRPYFRLDRIDYAAGDPFYGPQATDLVTHLLGLRVDPWPWAAVKVELIHGDPDPGERAVGVTAQVAFTF